MRPAADEHEMPKDLTSLGHLKEIRDLVTKLQDLGIEVLDAFHDYSDKVERAISMTKKDGICDPDEMAQVDLRQQKVQDNIKDLKNALTLLGTFQNVCKDEEEILSKFNIMLPKFDQDSSLEQDKDLILKVQRGFLNLEEIKSGERRRRRSTGSTAEPMQLMQAVETLVGHCELLKDPSSSNKYNKETSVQTHLSQAFLPESSTLCDLRLAVLDDPERTYKLKSGNATPASTRTDDCPDSIVTRYKSDLSDELDLAMEKQCDAQSLISVSDVSVSSKHLRRNSDVGLDSILDSEEDPLALVPVQPSRFIKERDYPNIFSKPSLPKNDLTVVMLDETSGELGQVAITLDVQKPKVSDIKKALLEKYGEAAAAKARLVIRSNGQVVDQRDTDKVRSRRAFVVGLCLPQGPSTNDTSR